MIFSKLPLFLAGAIASTASAAQFEGYIMDNQCVDLCRETTSDTPCTPDSSNAFYSPQRHTGWCLQLQVCINSGYSLMSLEPDESGKHSILMAFAGDESQQAVLDYVKTGPEGHFPRVLVSYNETSVDLESDADSIPQIFDAVISDPWDDDDDVYSGEDTTQKVCSDASDADIDSNNYCMRSDVMVKAGSNGMIVIESNGCPDHDNMMGGSGLISTTQEEPAFDGGKGVTSSCASGW